MQTLAALTHIGCGLDYMRAPSGHAASRMAPNGEGVAAKHPEMPCRHAFIVRGPTARDPRSAGRLMAERRLDQTGEQRMRLGRAGLELRMGLSGHEERMHLTRQFHEFSELTVGALA